MRISDWSSDVCSSDLYRNPTTQRGFAEKWGQKPAMVASFADGTKISFEQSVVANGTGFRVAKRGMLGPDFSNGDPGAPLIPIEETIHAFTERSEEHTSELQSLMRISYAVFCLKKKTNQYKQKKNKYK